MIFKILKIEMGQTIYARIDDDGLCRIVNNASDH
jgi:hypothetical protein